MLYELEELLKYLEQNLTLNSEQKIESRYRQALNYERVDRLPLRISFPKDTSAMFRPFPHRMVFDNPEIMLYNELVDAWGLSIAHRTLVGDDLPCTIRANFGTVIIASVFGAHIEQVDDNPPWVRHILDTHAFNYEKYLDIDPTDLKVGWCSKVISRYTFYSDVLKNFPNLNKIIKIVLPDLQGPLDVAEQIRGSELYVDLYAEPNKVGSLLDKISRLITNLAEYLLKFTTNQTKDYTFQHGTMMKGQILLRNDSCINVSPEMYEKQIRPFDEKILASLGGGIHSCGKVDHLIKSYLGSDHVRCFDLGQPELNNVVEAYAAAANRKIPLLGIKVKPDEIVKKQVSNKFNTGVTLRCECESLQKAVKVMKLYGDLNSD